MVNTTTPINTPNNTVTRKFSKTTKIFNKHKFRHFIPIISNPEALKKIYSAQDDSSSDIGADTSNFTTIEKLSELIQSTTTQANFTYEIIKDYYDIENIGNYLKITYITPDEFKTTLSKNYGLKDADLSTKLFPSSNNSSILNNNSVIETIFSKSYISNIKIQKTVDTVDASAEEKNSGLTSINVLSGKNVFHSKENPGLSVIQVVDPNLRACLKQSQELSVFFNLINTIDMSMAMPYLNIKFLVPASIKNGSEQRDYMVASFNNLLFGSKATTELNKEKYTNNAQAISGDFYRENYTYSQIRNNNVVESTTTTQNNNQNQPQNATQSTLNTSVGEYENITVERRVVDLGIFTSPQTMVNGDENLFGDYNSFDADEIHASRMTPVHDKFRPFMSIESIDFDVRPTKELMSFKTATINLILYDKSRLNDILPFVKPDLLGSFGSEILIEYGWQHILGDTEYVSENEINPIAEFINSLKNFEKYQIVNSSYSIQENGQVNINLNISMKGPIDLRGTQVPNNFFDLYILDNKINLFIKQIANSKLINKDNQQEYFVLDNNMKALLDRPTESNLTDLYNKYESFANNIIQNTTQQLKPLFTNKKNSILKLINKLKSEVKQQQNSIQDKLKNGLLNFLESEIDPFLEESPFISSYSKSVKFDKNKYISLGKVILGLLGKLIASSYKFDEVQMVFFNLNEKAIRARHLNIAQIPVNKEDFKTYVTNILTLTKQLSIEGLISLILKRYVNEKAAEVYGLNNYLVFNDQSETILKFELNQIKNNQNTTKTTTATQKKEYEASIATEIAKQYGYLDNQVTIPEYEYDLTFKLPMVRMTFDTLIHGSSDESLILRINFYDEHDNPFESMFDLFNNFQHKKITNAISTIQYLGTEFQTSDSNTPNSNEKMKKIKDRFTALFNFLLKQGIVKLEGSENEKGNTITSPSDLKNIKNIKINTTFTNELTKDKAFNNLKSMFKELLPSITYGAPNSAAISANVSSMQDAKLSTVFMTRDEQQSAKGLKFQLMEDMNLLPTRIIPSQVSAKIIGCPIVNFGQMIFFDFNTGTTIDNAYIVTGIKHSIGPGKFETDLTLTLADSYAKFLMSASTIKTFISMYNNWKDSQKEENSTVTNVSLNSVSKTIDIKQKVEEIKNKTGQYIFRISFM